MFKQSIIIDVARRTVTFLFILFVMVFLFIVFIYGGVGLLLGIAFLVWDLLK